MAHKGAAERASDGEPSVGATEGGGCRTTTSPVPMSSARDRGHTHPTPQRREKLRTSSVKLKPLGGKIAKQDQGTGHSVLLPRPGVDRYCKSPCGARLWETGCMVCTGWGVQLLGLCTAPASSRWSCMCLNSHKTPGGVNSFKGRGRLVQPRAKDGVMATG